MKNKQTEIWKPIKGYEGSYEISSKKKVKSLERLVHLKNGRIYKVKEKILKPTIFSKNKYISLNTNGKSKFNRLEYLFLQAFYGKDISFSDRIIDDKIIDLRQQSSDFYQKIKKNKDYPTGLSLDKRTNKFNSRLWIGKDQVHLGCFYDKEEAGLMYKKAVKYMHLYKGIPKYFREMLKQTVL